MLFWKSNPLRHFSTNSVRPSKSSHYDALGLTPKATQSDIKTAYYKLSMKYHPDKNQDIGAANKFRNIKEAYEVLGNVTTKKLYDKGVLSPSHHYSTPAAEAEVPDELKFYKSHSKRHVTPTMYGKTPLYDFDAWAKQHYGDTFKKKMVSKEKRSYDAYIDTTGGHSMMKEMFIYTFLSMSALMILAITCFHDDHDVVVLKDKGNNISNQDQNGKS